MRQCPRIAVIGALLALAALRAGAQDIPVNPPIAPFTNVFISLGNAFSNVDALNVRFDTTHYDAIAGHGFSIGGGFYIPFGKALFGAEFHDADFGYESTGTGLTNKMGSKYWMGTVGYALYTTWQFNVVAFLGAGMGTTTITVTYTVFQPGIGVDYLMLRTKKSHIGVTFGFRFGTTISPHRTAWTYEGRDVVGAPDAGPVGSFLRLSLGIGGFKLAQ